MGFFSDFLASRGSEPEAVAPSAPLTQEQFVAQNPSAYAQESSNPDYDYMLYQAQQEQIARAQAEAQLQQSNPAAYNAQKTQELADSLFNTFTTSGHVFGGRNNMEAENKAALEEFKQTDPNAYYNAKISLLARQAGWDAGQNKSNADTNAQIQNLAQEALRAGVPADQLSSLINTNFANTAEWHAKDIASRQGLGATFQGIEKVAPAFAAMITAGALAPAAGALEAGSAAGTIAAEGAGYAGGSLYGGGGTFLGEGLGTAAELMGPTYGELGITGVEGGFAGPTYGEMGYTGLNQQSAINAANAASQSANFSDALKYGNQARQAINLGSTLAKMAGVGGTSGTGATGGAGGTSQQQVANYLRNMSSPVQTNNYLGQIKMNETPFFGGNQGTLGGENVYDVSGTSAMANALRKK